MKKAKIEQLQEKFDLSNVEMCTLFGITSPNRYGQFKKGERHSDIVHRLAFLYKNYPDDLLPFQNSSIDQLLMSINALFNGEFELDEEDLAIALGCNINKIQRLRKNPKLSPPLSVRRLMGILQKLCQTKNIDMLRHYLTNFGAIELQSHQQQG